MILDTGPWARSRKLSEVGGDLVPPQTPNRQADRLTDEFPTGLGRTPVLRSLHNRADLALAVDLSESDRNYRVCAELPGVDERDVRIRVSNGVLTISGEKRPEPTAEWNRLLRTERRYGSFRHSIALPSDIDHERIATSFDKGVLTVAIAKRPTAQSKPKPLEVQEAA